MKLHSMKIYNFRNISSAEFEFSDINTFIGNNAQGKTNLMEAISVCMGKSFHLMRFFPPRLLRRTKFASTIAKAFSPYKNRIGSPVLPELCTTKEREKAS